MNKRIDPSELEHALVVAGTEPEPVVPHSRRKKLFAGLALAVLTGAAGWGGHHVLVAGRHVETDNAYVGADAAQVTPRVEGAVAEVLVRDTQSVTKDQVLVVLDDADARLRLAEAEAALAQAERRVQGWFANDRALSAQVAARAADRSRAAAQVASAQAEVEKAGLDLQRRKDVAASLAGAVSDEELTRSTNAYRQAESALAAARSAQAQADANRQAALGQLDANRVLTAHNGVSDNPEVTAARARRDAARLQLERTVIRSPVDGVVTRRQVQVGQRIQPGAPLMTVVPVREVYVDANFKEGQLAKVRSGQPVELTSDLYGDKVKFHGRVAGLSGGTGSAFALIPAQNATGNWIKVVQRVPVRVLLDPEELQVHPLRVGLSMTAKISLDR